MASTYSTNLKIQLMATGENSTTWGATTNVNLGTALEEAVVGSASVTFSSGDVTLTLTDVNTSQPARNLRLNLTGTSGGARNLIVPALNKVFIVNNGCADAITVKNATGTGVAVAAGKTMWVYNNGTNVVDVVTHLTSLTLASALPTPSGGTGLTGFTAANNAIYSTSASVLTAGTLPSGAGGTGLTGFSGANNAIYSTSASALTAGTLPTTAGGTGQTAYTNGQLLIGNTTSGSLSKATLTAGTGITITNDPGAVTIATSSAYVTSVNLSTGSTGLLVNGTTSNTITSSGVWDLTGTLATANGGTNLTGFTAANNAIYSTSASALTAGTLPSGAGGTGLSTFTAANRALYSTSASALTAGTLPSGAGGTGLTTFTAANSAIYSSSASALTAGTLPIAAGGTGAVTAAAALAALGVDTTAYLSGYITLGSIKIQWGYTGTITFSGSTSTFTTTATFPTTFATTCLGVVCTAAFVTGSAVGEVTISMTDALTTSGFTAVGTRLFSSGSEQITGFYIAIGY